MTYWTLAEWRDRLRRAVGQVPPSDPQPATGVPVPGAAPGQVPPAFPDPSNAVINDCLERVIADLNLTLGYNIAQQETAVVPAVPADYQGVQWLPLDTLVGTPGGNIEGVLSVLYQLGNQPGTGRTLTPTALSDRQRNRDDTLYLTAPPGIPTHYEVQGYRLGLYPASISPATIEMTLTEGMVAPATDADHIENIPANWQAYILYGVVIEVAARLPEDAEWAAKSQAYGPQWQRGLAMMMKNVLLQAAEYQPRTQIDTYRRSYGTQRLRT